MSKKIDLTILNALVKELNKQLSIVENIDAAEHKADHIVELSKVIGLLGSISSETVLLMGDFATLARPAESSFNDDILASLYPAKKTAH